MEVSSEQYIKIKTFLFLCNKTTVGSGIECVSSTAWHTCRNSLTRSVAIARHSLHRITLVAGCSKGPKAIVVCCYQYYNSTKAIIEKKRYLTSITNIGGRRFSKECFHLIQITLIKIVHITSPIPWLRYTAKDSLLTFTDFSVHLTRTWIDY